MEQSADKVREQHIVRGVLIVDKPDHSGCHNDGSHNNPNRLIVLGFHFPPLPSGKIALTRGSSFAFSVITAANVYGQNYACYMIAHNLKFFYPAF